MKKDDTYAYCFDLIFPEVGELIGGSEREDSYDVLKSSMEESGVDMAKMDWYLRTRKCKLQKIHDSIPFPIGY